MNTVEASAPEQGWHSGEQEPDSLAPNQVRFSESLANLRAYLSDSGDEEFQSLGSSLMRDQLLELIDRVEADNMWSVESDPNLEELFVSAVEGLINNPEQMSQMVGNSFGVREMQQAGLNAIGGRGTLGRVWRRLKELQLVVGVKRMRPSLSEASSSDITGLLASLSSNEGFDYRLSDVEDLVTSVDSHKSSVLSALRMRMASLAVESETEESTESSSGEEDSDTESSLGENEIGVVEHIEIERYGDDMNLVFPEDEIESSGVFSHEE